MSDSPVVARIDAGGIGLSEFAEFLRVIGEGSNGRYRIRNGERGLYEIVRDGPEPVFSDDD